MQTIRAGGIDAGEHFKPSAQHVEHETITLHQAVPPNANEYISEDFGNCIQCQLVDWTLNSVRSLLFYPDTRPEWGGSIPEITESEYKIHVLRPNASDYELVTGLVESNLYQEHNIEASIRTQMAQGTISALRDQIGQRKLTMIEWRQVIEGYLLNLGCEAQTRVDYKREIRHLKRSKVLGTDTTSRMSAGFRQYMMAQRGASTESMVLRVRVSEKEMQDIFQKVQLAIYRRLGLDWEADRVIF